MRLPSAGASAGIGGGFGAALGGMLGAPGASIRNMLDGLTGGSGDEDGSAFMRMLPGLLGLAGGGLAAASGVGIPLAMLAAGGIGGMGQAVGQASGDSSFDPISGRDLGAKAGLDLGSMGGMGLEMALDPTTYAGGLGGRAVGNALEKRSLGGASASAVHALEAPVAEAAGLASKAEATAGKGTLEQAAAHTPSGGGRNSWETFMDESNAASKAGYKPEVTAASPDFLKADPAKIGKSYQNVNAGLKDDLSLLGYANPGAGNSATLNAGQIPAWAESRGGWLMPSKQRMAAQASDGAGAAMMRNPDAVAAMGPKIDRAAGYEGLMSQKVGPSPSLNLTAEDLLSQSQKFDRMRADIPGLGGSNGHVPVAQGRQTSLEEWLKQMAESKITGRY